jgi:hypothetical protein
MQSRDQELEKALEEDSSLKRVTTLEEESSEGHLPL